VPVRRYRYSNYCVHLLQNHPVPIWPIGKKSAHCFLHIGTVRYSGKAVVPVWHNMQAIQTAFFINVVDMKQFF
jgi:hypothetical protein